MRGPMPEYERICTTCGKPIDVGQYTAWQGEKAYHVDCLTPSVKPILVESAHIAELTFSEADVIIAHGLGVAL